MPTGPSMPILNVPGARCAVPIDVMPRRPEIATRRKFLIFIAASGFGITRGARINTAARRLGR
jgi:hypothetical protein